MPLQHRNLTVISKSENQRSCRSRREQLISVHLWCQHDGKVDFIAFGNVTACHYHALSDILRQSHLTCVFLWMRTRRKGTKNCKTNCLFCKAFESCKYLSNIRKIGIGMWGWSLYSVLEKENYNNNIKHNQSNKQTNK